MYQVSDDYKQAMSRPVQRRRLSGTVGDISFNESNILDGSLEITNQFTDSSQIALGGVYIGQLKITFLSNLNVSRGSWNGKQIAITDELLIDEDNDIWEGVPLGIFEVSEAIWSAEGIAVTAYDLMSKFDKTCSLSTTSGTIYSLLALACQKCEMEMAQTEEEIALFPNGEVELGLYAENDINSWRDFISWVACTACSFATVNREGMLELRLFGENEVVTIPPSKRFQGGSFSDFSSYYTGMSYVNIGKDTTSYYHINPDNGLTMNVGSNPFLQYGLDSALEEQRKAVLNKLAEFDCVPFSIQMLGDPAIDLGDVIVFQNGIAGTESKGCVMQYDYKFGDSYSCSGFGEDPHLAAAQSKAEKNISGLSSRVDSASMLYHQFTNSEEITLGENLEKVASIRFATVKTTDVDIWHEFKILTTKNEESDRIICKAFYYLNGTLIDYQPIETWAIDGYHILGLKYHLTGVTNETQNVWEVFLQMEGGEGTIAVGDSNVVLGGQGMEAIEEWNGLIEIEENFGRFNIKANAPATFSATVDLVLTTNDVFAFEGIIDRKDITEIDALAFGANLYMDLHTVDSFSRMSSSPEIYSGADIGII